VQSGLFTLAVIGVVASVVGAYYYLRIVKIIYFDEPKAAMDPIDGEVKLVAYAAGAFVLLFVIPWIAAPVIAVAAAAAKSLY
jgi:NADH-quinone oxidoreductase subunit N